MDAQGRTARSDPDHHWMAQQKRSFIAVESLRVTNVAQILDHLIEIALLTISLHLCKQAKSDGDSRCFYRC